MPYSYNILAPPLHSTAEAAIQWFKQNWGIRSNVIEVEQAIHSDIQLSPTFTARTVDFHTLCVEVSDSLYPNYIDAFVLNCRDRGLPVKLFIATRKGQTDSEYAQKLKAAKRAGVGILEVDSRSGDVIQNALSLSLTGVRSVELTRFPTKYRHSLLQAEQTFRDGNPAKACSMVYDELEGAFRKLAHKLVNKGCWTKPAGWDIDRVAWATLIENVDTHLDRPRCGCPLLTNALMAQVLGTTPFRNATGHPIRRARDLINRDRALRTRFESAVDLLADFISATRRLRI